MSLNKASMDIVMRNATWRKNNPEKIREFNEAVARMEKKKEELAKSAATEKAMEHVGSGAFRGYGPQMSIIIGNDGSPLGGIVH